VATYFRKWKGQPGKRSPARPHLKESLWATVGTLLGLGAITALQFELSNPSQAMLLGSFGATAVLAYGVPSVPLAQPRNIVGGHIISACIGVSIRKLFVDVAECPRCLWFAAALAVATAIVAMLVTGTAHPPGGATALIAVVGEKDLLDLGWMYILTPAAAGACLMAFVALVVNNCPSHRHYPVYWW
jgi:CBS-domain-containing membrane protein